MKEKLLFVGTAGLEIASSFFVYALTREPILAGVSGLVAASVARSAVWLWDDPKSPLNSLPGLGDL